MGRSPSITRSSQRPLPLRPNRETQRNAPRQPKPTRGGFSRLGAPCRPDIALRSHRDEKVVVNVASVTGSANVNARRCTSGRDGFSIVSVENFTGAEDATSILSLR